MVINLQIFMLPKFCDLQLYNLRFDYLLIHQLYVLHILPSVSVCAHTLIVTFFQIKVTQIEASFKIIEECISPNIIATRTVDYIL